MIKCNNPKCGYEINWKGRYKICPKCGYVMHPVEKPNRATRQAIKEIEEDKAEPVSSIDDLIEG